jgi:hypothetical protein
MKLRCPVCRAWVDPTTDDRGAHPGCVVQGFATDGQDAFLLVRLRDLEVGDGPATEPADLTPLERARLGFYVGYLGQLERETA